jgi:hypothetical protein
MKRKSTDSVAPSSHSSQAQCDCGIDFVTVEIATSSQKNQKTQKSQKNQNESQDAEYDCACVYWHKVGNAVAEDGQGDRHHHLENFEQAESEIVLGINLIDLAPVMPLAPEPQPGPVAEVAEQKIGGIDISMAALESPSGVVMSGQDIVMQGQSPGAEIQASTKGSSGQGIDSNSIGSSGLSAAGSANFSTSNNDDADELTLDMLPLSSSSTAAATKPPRVKIKSVMESNLSLDALLENYNKDSNNKCLPTPTRAGGLSTAQHVTNPPPVLDSALCSAPHQLPSAGLFVQQQSAVFVQQQPQQHFLHQNVQGQQNTRSTSFQKDVFPNPILKRMEVVGPFSGQPSVPISGMSNLQVPSGAAAIVPISCNQAAAKAGAKSSVGLGSIISATSSNNQLLDLAAQLLHTPTKSSVTDSQPSQWQNFDAGPNPFQPMAPNGSKPSVSALGSRLPRHSAPPESVQQRPFVLVQNAISTSSTSAGLLVQQKSIPFVQQQVPQPQPFVQQQPQRDLQRNNSLQRNDSLQRSNSMQRELLRNNSFVQQPSIAALLSPNPTAPKVPFVQQTAAPKVPFVQQQAAPANPHPQPFQQQQQQQQQPQMHQNQFQQQVQMHQPVQQQKQQSNIGYGMLPPSSSVTPPDVLLANTDPFLESLGMSSSGKAMTASVQDPYFQQQQYQNQQVILHQQPPAQQNPSAASNQAPVSLAPQSTGAMGGFSTASGKQLTTNQDALDKVRKLFGDDISSLSGDKDESKEQFTSSFGSAGALNDSSASNADAIVPQDLPHGFGGFKTAGGKALSINQEAIDRARKLFGDDFESPTDNSDGFSSFAPIGASKSRFSSFSSAGAGGNAPTNFGGFTTAGGKTISLNQGAINKAKKLFGDDFEEPVDSGFASGGQSNTGAQSCFPPTGAAASSSFTGGGFHSASGKALNVDATALAKAKKLCGEGDSNDTTASAAPSCGLTGFQTASGKSMNINAEALARAKQLFGDDMPEIENDASGETSGFQNASGGGTRNSFQKASRGGFASVGGGGFQTASGKSMGISADALKRAKALFGDDFDFHEFSHTKNQKQSSTDNMKMSPPASSSNQKFVSSSSLKQEKPLLQIQEPEKPLLKIVPMAGADQKPVLAMPKQQMANPGFRPFKRPRMSAPAEIPTSRPQNLDPLLQMSQDDVFASQEVLFAENLAIMSKPRLLPIPKSGLAVNAESELGKRQFAIVEELRKEISFKKKKTNDASSSSAEASKTSHENILQPRIEWFECQYRQIVRSLMTSNCIPFDLTSQTFQLDGKYRSVLKERLKRRARTEYLGKRSILRRICEGDRAAETHMNLLITGATFVNNILQLEVTDGWYFLKAKPDRFLTSTLKKFESCINVRKWCFLNFHSFVIVNQTKSLLLFQVYTIDRQGFTDGQSCADSCLGLQACQPESTMPTFGSF